jgi:hypothetical protein
MIDSVSSGTDVHAHSRGLTCAVSRSMEHADDGNSGLT